MLTHTYTHTLSCTYSFFLPQTHIHSLDLTLACEAELTYVTQAFNCPECCTCSPRALLLAQSHITQAKREHFLNTSVLTCTVRLCHLPACREKEKTLTLKSVTAEGRAGDQERMAGEKTRNNSVNIKH